MKLEFSEKPFRKHSHIKFHDNPSCGSRVPCGQADERTDRRDEAYSLFSKCFERA